MQRQIYFRGAYEPIEAFLFERLLRPNMVVIDGGANVGQYALIAAAVVGPHGEVHAFEPVPKTFHRLEHNVLENGLQDRVSLSATALWHRAEPLQLRLPPDMIGNDGSYTIAGLSESIGTVDCVGMRLDDYATERGLERVDVVKLDVEGAEWFALQGATQVVSRWRPTMLIEINRETCGRLGYKPDEIWSFLQPFGYVMWSVGDSAETCRTLLSLRGVDRANVIFHVDDLPREITEGWTLKSVLRFHRRDTSVFW